MAGEWDCPKMDLSLIHIYDRIFAHYDEMAAALRDADKLARQDKVAELKEAIKAEFTEEEQVAWEREIPVNLKKLEKTAMRRMVVETGERVDGRTAAEIRPIMVKGDYLPLVHGSGLFQRGQTQVLSVLSLGMLNEGQRLDTIGSVDGKRYMHHYNFCLLYTSASNHVNSCWQHVRAGIEDINGDFKGSDEICFTRSPIPIEKDGQSFIYIHPVSYTHLDVYKRQPGGLLKAAEYVEAVQSRQGYYIACIEEIAYRRGFIGAAGLRALGEAMGKTAYGRYLLAVADEGEPSRRGCVAG